MSASGGQRSMRVIDLEQIDFGTIVRRGDTVVWGQVCAEPTSLTRRLLAQRERIGNFQVLLGLRMADTVQAEHADCVRMLALNAGGSNRSLAKAGVLDMLPMHVSEVDRALRSGVLGCDVALVQVSPPDARGHYSLGLSGDYTLAAVKTARVVIAEINAQVPWVPCQETLTDADIDLAVHVDLPLPQIAPAVPSSVDERIAALAEPFIEDGSTLQLGVGGAPDALMQRLGNRRGLGIHSGVLSDSFVDLVAAGAITNEHKPHDRGVSVSGVLMGTQRLYHHCATAPVRLCPLSYTHDLQLLASMPKFVSINSALEIDLTGQVNAESIGTVPLGGVGGQVDFIRGAALSRGGVSMIVLPSLSADGSRSRIVRQLSGPVTTARSDVDLVITEHGVARLKGRSIRQRIEAMAAICAPAQRDQLLAGASL